MLGEVLWFQPELFQEFSTETPPVGNVHLVASAECLRVFAEDETLVFISLLVWCWD
jgi:hypothetical protein